MADILYSYKNYLNGLWSFVANDDVACWYQEYRTTQGEGVYVRPAVCVREIEHLSLSGVDYIIRCQYVAIDSVNHLTFTDKTWVFPANHKSRSNLFVSWCILGNSCIYQALYLQRCQYLISVDQFYLLWTLNWIWNLKTNIVALPNILT